MKRLKQATTLAAVWGGQFGALYAWEVLGIEGAGNLLTFWLATMLVLTMLYVLLVDYDKPYTPGLRLPAVVRATKHLLFIGALVWFGHAWLAVIYALTNVVAIGIDTAWKKAHEERLAKGGTA